MVLARNLPIYAYKVCKIFMQCEVTGGKFISNIETAGFDYFGIDELPCLAEEKNNDSRSWMGASAITKSVDFEDTEKPPLFCGSFSFFHNIVSEITIH